MSSPVRSSRFRRLFSQPDLPAIVISAWAGVLLFMLFMTFSIQSPKLSLASCFGSRGSTVRYSRTSRRGHPKRTQQGCVLNPVRLLTGK